MKASLFQLVHLRLQRTINESRNFLSQQFTKWVFKPSVSPYGCSHILEKVKGRSLNKWCFLDLSKVNFSQWEE